MFEAERGAEYALGDMSVLDVASLHWSKPRAVGDAPPERVGHATAVLPLRIHATPSTQMSTPAPGAGPEAGGAAGGRFGYDGSVQLSSLVAHCAHIARQAGGLSRATTRPTLNILLLLLHLLLLLLLRGRY